MQYSINGRLFYSGELYHYGVEGMHWGVRRYQPYPSDYHGDGKYTGRSNREIKKTLKMAKKDAKRYANAKMYYGEGAGTRRKLLKAELDKKQKDPVYKEAFGRYAENADYARSAQRAKVERKTRDTAIKAKRITRTYAMPVAMIAASAYYATHKQQVDAFLSSQVDNVVKTASNFKNSVEVKRFVRSIMR